MKNPFGPGLQVALHTSRDGAFFGRFYATRVAGQRTCLVLDFDPDRRPEVEIGDTTQVVLTGGAVSKPLRAVGRVIHLEDYGGDVRVILLLGGEGRGVPLRPIETRRNNLRVSGADEAPVVVIARRIGEERGVKVKLHDLSWTGLSILVPLAQEGHLADAWAVEVELTLPGEPEGSRLVGNVCYRRPAGREIHYGIEFDADATEEFEREIERVGAFVRRRIDASA
ncbi:MAG: PilZ domain-containing protein [Planctomycetota bacterium]